MQNQDRHGCLVVARQKSPGFIQVTRIGSQESYRLTQDSRPLLLLAGGEYIVDLRLPEVAASVRFTRHVQQSVKSLEPITRHVTDNTTTARWTPQLISSSPDDDWINVVALAVMLDRFPDMIREGETLRSALKRLSSLSRGTASEGWINKQLDTAFRGITNVQPGKNTTKLGVVVTYFREIGYFSDGQMDQLRDLHTALDGAMSSATKVVDSH